MPIDVHAHYVPPQLIDAVDARGAIWACGWRRRRASDAGPAFDYGFKVRPFFPRLIEPVEQRHAWLDQQGIDLQVVGTWPDIFGYGLPADACSRLASDVERYAGGMVRRQLGSLCLDRLGSADAGASRRTRTRTRQSAMGAVGVIISANIENSNIGEATARPVLAQAEALGCRS